LALIQKASDMARDDCARAMDMAHKLSFQLRAVEERMRELESETARYRDRAARAEAWLVRIRSELEQMFFHPKERENKQI
jgi:DNA repair ATPase RecN